VRTIDAIDLPRAAGIASGLAEEPLMVDGNTVVASGRTSMADW
jgi:hypothetical protein